MWNGFEAGYNPCPKSQIYNLESSICNTLVRHVKCRGYKLSESTLHKRLCWENLISPDVLLNGVATPFGEMSGQRRLS
jgi:hypothetical protein